MTAATVTHIDYDMVIAEDAPLGVQLWPTIRPSAAPNFTLDKVAVVRTVNGEHVVWTYQNGATRTFSKGEQVACQIAR